MKVRFQKASLQSVYDPVVRIRIEPDNCVQCRRGFR